MKKILVILSVLLLTTSCANIYIVRERTISSILNEIRKSEKRFYQKRVRISGWAKVGFEHQAIYDTKEDLENSRYDKSLWLNDGLPLPYQFDDYDKKGYTYRICKVTIEGTVSYMAPLEEGIGGTAGHMGAWTASLVDTFVTIESEVESRFWSWTEKDYVPSQSINRPSHSVDPFEHKP